MAQGKQAAAWLGAEGGCDLVDSGEAWGGERILSGSSRIRQRLGIPTADEAVGGGIGR
jgi:hypothetical protein